MRSFFYAWIAFLLLLTATDIGQSREIFNQRLDSGLPLGGLGTGKIELMTDGSYDRFSINNNPHQLIENPDGCFAAIGISGKSITACRQLILKESSPQGMESVQFEGVFPFATVDFSDSELPIAVRLQAFSPFVAGNKEDSAIPAAVLIYTVTNESNETLDVSLAMSWQNFIGVGGTAERIFNPAGECIHEIFDRRDYAGIQFQFKPEQSDPQGQNAVGDYTLFAEGNRRDTFSFLPMWNPDKSPDEFWNVFSKNHSLPAKKGSETQTASGSQRPAAAIAIHRKIAAGEGSSFVFLLAWNMPHWISEEGTDYGVFYANRWDSSYDIARDVSKDRERLLEETKKWQKPYWDSGLPEWLIAHVFNGLGSLPSSTVFLKDGRFAALSADSRWPGNLQSPEELLLAYPFLRRYYPNLLENIFKAYIDKQLPGGEIPTALGNIYSFFEEKEVPGSYQGRPDSTAAFVLMIVDYYYWTGNREFLTELFPNLRNALYWIMRQDTDHDEIPDGPSLMASAPEQSTSLFTADLWLATLRMGEELGGLFGDIELQSQCRRNREIAERRIVNQFWNGRFFTHSISRNILTQDQQENSSLAYPGEWFAATQDWNFLMDREFLFHSLRNISNQILNRTESKPEAQTNLSDFRFTRLTEPFFASLLARMGETDIAFSFVRKLSGNPINDPLSIHHDRQRTSPPSLLGLSSWLFMDSVSGVGIDMHRRCLIVGPQIPATQESFTWPLRSPVYSGMVHYQKSPVTGQENCTIAFDTSVTKRDLALQQVAFRVPVYLDSNQVLLRVMHNGEYISGQDFSRETLRVYSFESPLEIRRGDELTLLLARKESGIVNLQLSEQQISNFGAKCSIEKLMRPAPGMSFQLINLLRENQIIHLEVSDPGEEEYEIYLDDQKLIAVSAEMEPLPVVLQSSPVPYEDYALLRQAQIGCADCIRQLAGQSGGDSIKSRIWSLQEIVEEAISMDTAIRGIQIDVLLADSDLTRSGNRRDQVDAKDVVKTINDAKNELQKFLRDLPQLTRDPVLASQFAGYFLPIVMDVQSIMKRPRDNRFNLEIDMQNPLQLPISMRVQTQLPMGWTASTADSVSLEGGRSQTKSHQIVYAVTPAQSLMNRRFELTVSLAGTWNDIPFRKEKIHTVGHNFVKDWLVAGPFPNEGGEGFDQIFPLEMNIKPNETYEGIEGTVGWKKASFPSGFVDFNSIFSPNDYAVGFAYVGVYSPREQAVRFEIGSTDGIKIYHNYKEIFAKRRLANDRPSAEEVFLQLYQGWNHILVKVNENTGSWGFYFEITDLEGRTIPTLAYSLEKL